MSKSQIYQTVILEHYRNPKNYGTIENPTVKYRDSNPLCGDTVEIYLKIDDGKISDIKFSGEGCAISQAGASMLTEKMKNKSLEEAKEFLKEDMIKLFGNINFGPIRIKCALLAYKVFKMALYSYLGLKEKEV